MRTAADRLAIEQGAYWDDDQGDRLVRFAHTIFAPQFVVGAFRLLEWQERFLRSLMSWRNADSTRRFRFANLHCPKKVGKTLLCSLLSSFELVASTDPSPFVVTGSVSKDNAGQVFSEIRNTLTTAKLDKFCQITPNTKRIRIASTNAEYRSLASDGDRVQGYNASLVVLDECHAHKSASLYDSLKYATIARPNGMVVAISTAGDDPTTYYHGIYEKSKRVLAGEDLDTTHFALVFESDPDADPEDVGEWYRACPSLGVSFSEDQFRRDLEAAKNSNDRAEWLRFLRYRLNRWTRSDDLQYFDVHVWDKGKVDNEPEGLAKLDSWLGLDLSQTTDPSSCVQLFALPDGSHYVKCWAWVCREGVKLREKTSLPKYQQHESEGWLTITDGDRIDDVLILNHVLDLCRDTRVKGIVCDATSAIVMMGRVGDATGIDCVRMVQTARNYNAPLQLLNKAMHQNKIKHDGNNWLRYALHTLRIGENRQGEIYPVTKRSADHIDSALALLMAYSLALQPSTNDTGVICWGDG